MFKSLLLISCLGFVVGCGECTEVEPTVVEPTVAEPTVAEPTVVEPTIVEPTAVEPTVVDPRVWVGDATEDDLDMLFAGLYTEITGNLIFGDTRRNTFDLPQLETIGGNLVIFNNSFLPTTSLPQLQSVGGYVNITYNSGPISHRLATITINW